VGSPPEPGHPPGPRLSQPASDALFEPGLPSRGCPDRGGCPLDRCGDHARRPGALGQGLPRLPRALADRFARRESREQMAKSLRVCSPRLSARTVGRWPRRGPSQSSASRRQRGSPGWTRTRSGTGRAGTATSPCPCWLIPGWPRSAARPRPKERCPSALASVTVPEVRRWLVVAPPLPALAGAWGEPGAATSVVACF
jgi:hypothetical protein